MHPSQLGARCDRCVLRGRHFPVETEWTGSRTLVLGSLPGVEEVEEGRPQVGPGGMELMAALQQAGVHRSQVSIANVICCQPPNKDLDRLDKQIAKRNAGIDKRDRDMGNPDYRPTPAECCAPRLAAELAGVDNVVALGKHAIVAAAPHVRSGVMDVRGTLVTRKRAGGESLKILPTVLPGHVLHQQRWRHVFRADISRAFRWFRGGLLWREPEIKIQPTGEELHRFLFDTNTRFHAYDCETDGIDALNANLRCLGFGTEEKALVVPFLSIDGFTHYDSRLQAEVIRDWFRSDRRKVGHNAGVFDRMVMESRFGVRPRNLLDSLPLHKAVASEMPHNLGFIGSYYTDIHAWKADKTATEAVTNYSLHKYCGLDCVVNARIMAPLVQGVLASKQAVGAIGKDDDELLRLHNRSPVDRDHAMQVVAVGLRKAGMLVDQTAARKWDVRIRGELVRWYGLVQDHLAGAGVNVAANREDSDDREQRTDDEDDDEGYVTADEAAKLRLDLPSFNPGSPLQVSAVLFDAWDLPEPLDLKPKDIYTKGGSRATSSAVLQAYIVDKRLTQQQRALCHAILMWRKQKKLLSQYIFPIYRDGAGGGSALSSDGRVRADWNILPIVGRFNCGGSYPLQGIPSKFSNANMKDMFVPGEGRVFVGADVNSFHLVLMANIWRIRSLLEVFAQGHDAHSVFAETVMGDTFRKARGYNGYGKKPTKGTLADQLRDVAKRLRFAGAYGATPPTIFRVLRSAMDEDGNLLNPGLRLDQVYAMHDAWMRAEPEWQAAWDAAWAIWTARGGVAGGYLESPVLRRRRYCMDGNPNDVYNFGILAAEGDIAGDFTCGFVQDVPFDYAGKGTGLVHQGHDAMTAECPEADAPRVGAIMKRRMTLKIEGWPVEIAAGVDIGDRYSKV